MAAVPEAWHRAMDYADSDQPVSVDLHCYATSDGFVMLDVTGPRCGRHALLALRAQVAIAVAETLLDKAGEAQAGPRCIGCLEPVAINEPDCGATACRQVWLFDRVGTLS
jgi:hypothetical protein